MNLQSLQLLGKLWLIGGSETLRWALCRRNQASVMRSTSVWWIRKSGSLTAEKTFASVPIIITCTRRCRSGLPLKHSSLPSSNVVKELHSLFLSKKVPCDITRATAEEFGKFEDFHRRVKRRTLRGSSRQGRCKLSAKRNQNISALLYNSDLNAYMYFIKLQQRNFHLTASGNLTFSFM